MLHFFADKEYAFQHIAVILRDLETNLAVWGFYLWFQYHKVIFKKPRFGVSKNILFLSQDSVQAATVFIVSAEGSVAPGRMEEEWTSEDMLTGCPRGSTTEEDQRHQCQLKWQAERELERSQR